MTPSTPVLHPQGVLATQPQRKTETYTRHQTGPRLTTKCTPGTNKQPQQRQDEQRHGRGPSVRRFDCNAFLAHEGTFVEATLQAQTTCTDSHRPLHEFVGVVHSRTAVPTSPVYGVDFSVFTKKQNINFQAAQNQVVIVSGPRNNSSFLIPKTQPKTGFRDPCSS